MLDNDMIYRYARVRVEQLLDGIEEHISRKEKDGLEANTAFLELREIYKQELSEIDELIKVSL